MVHSSRHRGGAAKRWWPWATLVAALLLAAMGYLSDHEWYTRLQYWSPDGGGFLFENRVHRHGR